MVFFIRNRLQIKFYLNSIESANFLMVVLNFEIDCHVAGRHQMDMKTRRKYSVIPEILPPIIPEIPLLLSFPKFLIGNPNVFTEEGFFPPSVVFVFLSFDFYGLYFRGIIKGVSPFIGEDVFSPSVSLYALKSSKCFSLLGLYRGCSPYSSKNYRDDNMETRWRGRSKLTTKGE